MKAVFGVRVETDCFVSGEGDLCVDLFSIVCVMICSSVCL